MCFYNLAWHVCDVLWICVLEQRWQNSDLRFDCGFSSNIYPFELYLNFRYVHGCACIFVSYLLHLRARFVHFCFSRGLNISVWYSGVILNFSLTVSILFSLPILCSHSGWHLFKWSAIGLGDETNCRIAHILGILLMISYWMIWLLFRRHQWSVQFLLLLITHDVDHSCNISLMWQI